MLALIVMLWAGVVFIMAGEHRCETPLCVVVHNGLVVVTILVNAMLMGYGTYLFGYFWCKRNRVFTNLRRVSVHMQKRWREVRAKHRLSGRDDASSVEKWGQGGKGVGDEGGIEMGRGSKGVAREEGSSTCSTSKEKEKTGGVLGVCGTGSGMKKTSGERNMSDSGTVDRKGVSVVNPLVAQVLPTEGVGVVVVPLLTLAPPPELIGEFNFSYMD